MTGGSIWGFAGDWSFPGDWSFTLTGGDTQPREPEKPEPPKKKRGISIARDSGPCGLCKDDPHACQQAGSSCPIPKRHARTTRAHFRNRQTALAHDTTIETNVHFVEAANNIGAKPRIITEACEKTGATVAVIRSLRRLAVGEAQTQVIHQLDQAGIRLVTEEPEENAILNMPAGPERDIELANQAALDLREWLLDKKRRQLANPSWLTTPQADRALTFISERPHLRHHPTILAKALQTYGIRTSKGKTLWYRQTLLRAWAEIDRRAREGWDSVPKAAVAGEKIPRPRATTPARNNAVTLVRAPPNTRTVVTPLVMCDVKGPRRVARVGLGARHELRVS